MATMAISTCQQRITVYIFEHYDDIFYFKTRSNSCTCKQLYTLDNMRLVTTHGRHKIKTLFTRWCFFYKEGEKCGLTTYNNTPLV